MPIITGFPPSNTISPSVRITEQDLSYYAAEPTFHNAGIVGFCSKGPINKPTLITSKNQLNRIFGYPHPDVGDPFLIYAAEQYLLVANQLYVVRCADTDQVSDECAQTAYYDVPAAGSLISVIGDTPKLLPSAMTGTASKHGGIRTMSDGTLQTIQVYEYNFETAVFPNGGAFFRFALNGQVSPNTLVIPVPATGDFQVPMPQCATYSTGFATVTCVGSTVSYGADVLAAELNQQINPEVDGIEFTVSDQGLIEVQTVWAYGPGASLEFLSVQDSAYGVMYRASGVTDSFVNVNVMQLSTGAKNNQNASPVGSISQSCISTVNCYGPGTSCTPGTWNFTHLTGLNLQIVVAGTDNQNLDNKVQIFDLTAIAGYPNLTTTGIATYIQAQITASLGALGGFYAVVDASNYLRFDTRCTGSNAQIIVKPNSTAAAFFGFDVLTKGGSGSNNSMSVTSDLYPFETVFGGVVSGEVSFRLEADSAGIEGNGTSVTIVNNIADNVFNMGVYNNGIQVESWGGLTMDVTSSRYVGTYLPLVSDYVQAHVAINTGAFVSQPPPKDGTYVLGSVLGTEGRDGIPSLPDAQDALLAGNALGYTGLYALSDPEQMDIDIIAIPGHSSTDIISELIDFCQNYRQDCIAIVDPPFGLSVKEIIAWQNGSHPFNLTRFDSDFLALYWPWVKIHDSYNRIDVWVPPSGSIMAVYARNDALAQPWFAPAGETRGIVPGITDVYNRPTLAERDAMYGNFNCINPIVQFSDLTNFVVWGQKTMQRLPTALDRVNVRRLMFVIEKQIRHASRHMLFDPHDEIFDKKFINMCSRILDNIKVGRGIYDYIIKADASINTPDVIDRNEFRANIGIQPEKAVEFMFLTFSIHRTGDWTANSAYL